MPVVEAATPGRYILYKNQHFSGLRIYSDGQCAITTTHRSQDNQIMFSADVALENYEAIFALSSLHGASTGSFEHDELGGSHCCALLVGVPTSAAAALPVYLGLASTVRLFASVPKQRKYDSIRNTLEGWLCRIRDVKTWETAQDAAQQKSLTSGRKIPNGIIASGLLAARNAWFGVGSVIERLKDVEAPYPGLSELPLQVFAS